MNANVWNENELEIHGTTRYPLGKCFDICGNKEYFSFVRDFAALDFSGWQGNDFQVTKELWEHVKKYTKEYHEPGKFITFLGYKS